MPEEQTSIRQFAQKINVSDTFIRNRIADGTITRGIIQTDKHRPRLIPSVAMEELGLDIAEFGGAHTHEPGDDPGLRDYTDGIPDDTPKSEADRLVQLYKARKARLEYMETESSLINKGLVYSKLFDFAQGVRDALMNVPDRCIDNVIAADNRNTAIKVMGDEIASALTTLSRAADLEIIEKR